MAVSLSFMLPIGKFSPSNTDRWTVLVSLATPPNAMIFSSGDVKIRDLIIAGTGMKIFGSLVILFASTTFLSPIFHAYLPQESMNSTFLNNITMGMWGSSSGRTRFFVFSLTLLGLVRCKWPTDPNGNMKNNYSWVLEQSRSAENEEEWRCEENSSQDKPLQNSLISYYAINKPLIFWCWCMMVREN